EELLLDDLPLRLETLACFARALHERIAHFAGRLHAEALEVSSERSVHAFASEWTLDGEVPAAGQLVLAELVHVRALPLALVRDPLLARVRLGVERACLRRTAQAILQRRKFRPALGGVLREEPLLLGEDTAVRLRGRGLSVDLDFEGLLRERVRDLLVVRAP